MPHLRHLFLAAPVALAACSPGAGVPPGLSFLDPGVRAGQERACAQAVAQTKGVAAGSVQVTRTSADAQNGAVVMARTGPITGYCRVSGDLRVLRVVF